MTYDENNPWSEKTGLTQRIEKELDAKVLEELTRKRRHGTDLQVDSYSCYFCRCLSISPRVVAESRHYSTPSATLFLTCVLDDC